MEKPHIYKNGRYWIVDESGLLFKKQGSSICCGVLTRGFTARAAWLRYTRSIRERNNTQK